MFKTTDGGKTWKKMLFINDQTGASRSRWTGRTPTCSTPACGAGTASRGRSSAADRRAKAASTSPPTAASTGRTSANGFPDDLIGKIYIDIAQQPEGALRDGRGHRRQGRSLSLERRGATWTLVNSSQRLRARPFYFNYVNVNPKNENEVWVNELGVPRSTDGGKTFTECRRRTATTTACGSTRTTRRS